MAIETEVALLRQEVTNNKDLITRLAATTDKIGEVSSYVAKILAVHDERIQSIENKAADIVATTEKRRIEVSEELKEVNERIVQMHGSLSDELEHSNSRIMEKLDDMKIAMSQDKKDYLEDKATLDKRLRTLENWRWMLVGGGVVLGFVMGKIPLVTQLLQAAHP